MPRRCITIQSRSQRVELREKPCVSGGTAEYYAAGLQVLDLSHISAGILSLYACGKAVQRKRKLTATLHSGCWKVPLSWHRPVWRESAYRSIARSGANVRLTQSDLAEDHIDGAFPLFRHTRKAQTLKP